jgi:hypothetical protein
VPEVLALLVFQYVSSHPRINGSFCLISSTEVLGHPNPCEFSHSQIASANLFDDVLAYCKPLGEKTCSNEWLFAEKLRYDLSNVPAREGEDV